MFNNTLKKYNFFRNKFFSEQIYNISSFELFEILLTKKINKPKFNILEFLTNLINFFLSIITIYKCKILKISRINYFIVFNNDLSDPRSNHINSIIDINKNINIIKTSSLRLSLLSFFKFKNVIFHESIIYFSRFFYKEKKFTIKEKFKSIHKCKLRQYNIYCKIFKYLNIKKFIMIDDYREIQIFIKICKKLKIESIGYMHSRFSKYRVSLKYDCFDRYIVWTNYFKKKLIEINPNYKNKVLVSNFRNFKKTRYRRPNKDLKLLFFSDSRMDYKSVISYLNQLKKKKIKVFVKLKTNQIENNVFLNYINNNDFIKIDEKNVATAVRKYNPQFFVATNSNVLLEASLYNCFPILLKTNNDYSFDLIKDKISFPYSGKSDFYHFLRKLMNKRYLIDKIYNKVWKSNNDFRSIKNFLN